MGDLERVRDDTETLQHMQNWKLVDGPCRCERCGSLTQKTWRYFPAPATWTHALCEPCVETITEED